MASRTRWLSLLVVVVLFALAGCSGGGSYATVSGTITHNGAAVDGAKVNFYSTVEIQGAKAGSYSALTDSSGKYLIAQGANKEPGIPPGMYKVTIQKLDIKGNLPADYDAGQLEASGMAKNLMPKEYENVKTTKLSVTLEAGKNENKDFELKGTGSGSTPVVAP